MKSRTVVFELEEYEFSLAIKYKHTSRPACRIGHPDTWTPDESESEIELPANLKAILEHHATTVLVPAWMQSIQNQASDLEFDGAPAEWDEE